MESKEFSLNRDEAKAIMRGLLVALAGAALTYTSQVVGDIDFGIYTPLAVAVASVLVNAGRKYIQGE